MCVLCSDRLAKRLRLGKLLLGFVVVCGFVAVGCVYAVWAICKLKGP